MSNEVEAKPGLPSEGTVVEEGTAKVHFRGDVFYNPVQVFNRDMSIHVIKLFQEIRRKEKVKKLRKKLNKKRNADVGEASLPSEKDIPGISILEALSATGLRSVRYVKEIPGVRLCLANDISAEAVEHIRENVKSNGVSTDVLRASHSDAVTLMHAHKTPKERFDVVDLDPYGAPSVFLDSAVQAVSDGGLMCVTSTDTAVLCGAQAAACLAKYGSMPVKGRYCHEMALRILLCSIDTHANRYGRYIVPLMSVSTDFYVRVFVRVFTSKAEVKLSATKRSYLYQAAGCDSFTLHPLGKSKAKSKHVVGPNTARQGMPSFEEFYDQSWQIGGPIWSDPIHDADFVSTLSKRLGETCPEKAPSPGFPTGRRWMKMKGVLCAIEEETECNDCPLYYSLHSLANTIHCECPTLLSVFSALRNGGYRAVGSHANQTAIKTDAPNSVMWDIMRGHVKKYPVSAKRLKGTSPCAIILSKEPTFIADFTTHPKAVRAHAAGTRFPMNPEKFWGPKSRAKSTKTKKNEKKKNQSNARKRGESNAQTSKRPRNGDDQNVDARERKANKKTCPADARVGNATRPSSSS